MTISTVRPIPTTPRARGGVPGYDAVTIWLMVMIVMVFVMVVLGGVTRLTQSGLSIVDWNPIMGAIPPLTAADWHDAFAAYRHFPEYKDVNYGMTLADFKAIYLMEYVHRLWGRLIGLAFALPYLWFLLRGRVRGRFAWELAGILALGAAQGVMGWIMVRSGLVDRPSVSQYRLAAHLAIAVTIYLLLLWVVMTRTLPRQPAGAEALRRPALMALVLALITMAAGAFVAGLDAGLSYNTFPLMDGKLVPDGILMLKPLWRNFFENVATVQFDHRVLAISTVIAVLALVLSSTRLSLPLPARAARAVYAALVMVLVQATLGITTLIFVVPTPLAACHQAGALVLVATLLWVVFETRKPA